MKSQACLDTGAVRSIIGRTLYEKIKDKVTFTKENIVVKLADGSMNGDDVYSCILDVTLNDKIITNKFLALTTCHDNCTLLGMDFIRQAQLVLDLCKDQWYFSEHPEERYSFVNGNHQPATSPVINSIELRPDEAKDLTRGQR